MPRAAGVGATSPEAQIAGLVAWVSLSTGGYGRNSGPRDILLITIRHGLQKPFHFCFWLANSALPQLEDAPTQLQKFVSVFYISLHVLLEFRAPEVFARTRIGRVPALGVSVPEAAMNEYADAVAR